MFSLSKVSCYNNYGNFSTFLVIWHFADIVYIEPLYSLISNRFDGVVEWWNVEVIHGNNHMRLV